MTEKRDIHFRTMKTVEVVAPELKAKLADFRMRLAVINSGYPKVTDWHPGIKNRWGTFPKAGFDRRSIHPAELSLCSAACMERQYVWMGWRRQR
jgi:hypothetical protein